MTLFKESAFCYGRKQTLPLRVNTRLCVEAFGLSGTQGQPEDEDDDDVVGGGQFSAREDARVHVRLRG